MTSKSWDTLIKIADSIGRDYEKEVPTRVVRVLIMKEVGIAERTIQEYIRRLKELDYLRDGLNPNFYVLGPRCGAEQENDYVLSNEERSLLDSSTRGTKSKKSSAKQKAGKKV